MRNKFKQLMVTMSYMDIHGDWDTEELKYDAKFITVAFTIAVFIIAGIYLIS